MQVVSKDNIVKMKSDWGDMIWIPFLKMYMYIVLGKSERGREKEKENEMTMFHKIHEEKDEV